MVGRSKMNEMLSDMTPPRPGCCQILVYRLGKEKKKMQLTLNFNWIVETKRKDPSKDPFHKIPFGTFQSNGMN